MAARPGRHPGQGLGTWASPAWRSGPSWLARVTVTQLPQQPEPSFPWQAVGSQAEARPKGPVGNRGGERCGSTPRGSRDERGSGHSLMVPGPGVRAVDTPAPPTAPMQWEGGGAETSWREGAGLMVLAEVSFPVLQGCPETGKASLRPELWGLFLGAWLPPSCSRRRLVGIRC